MIPIQPKLKGRVGWDSKIAQLPRNALGPLQQIIQQPWDIDERSGSYPICLTCPQCKNESASNSITIKQQDLDIKSKCNKCKHNIKARDWMCKCRQPWHLCDIHMSCASKYTKGVVPTHKSCKGIKRAIGPLTHEQLVELDNKRMRKKPRTILAPAPNILSAKLRERFAHIL